MRPTFKELAASVREVWAPPAGRAWSQGDLRIVKLLRAIEEAAPGQPDRATLDRWSEWLGSHVAGHAGDAIVGDVKAEIDALRSRVE